MLFATKYTFKGDQSPESVREMLAVFAEQGAQEGEVDHAPSLAVRALIAARRSLIRFCRARSCSSASWLADLRSFASSSSSSAHGRRACLAAKTLVVSAPQG